MITYENSLSWRDLVTVEEAHEDFEALWDRGWR